MQSPLNTQIRGLILDMDGVLWRDTQLIVDLPTVFGSISKRGWRVILATNNTTQTVNQYVKKMNDFSVQLENWQVINSAQATAQYLKEQHPQGGKVYVIGEEGLVQSLKEKGFETADRNVLAVVAGMDRHVTYEKLRRATLLIRDGTPFVGTNPDRSFPTPAGLVPGAGAILAAIEAASDVPPIIIGKPSSIMYRQALEKLGVAPSETLVVGDRLETDIQGGQATGCKTALVLSGVTSPEAARSWTPAPDIIATDLVAVLDRLA